MLAARCNARCVSCDAPTDVLAQLPARHDWRIALGANPGGTLDAIAHEAITVTSQYEDFHRQETGWSSLLYKCANARYAQARAARLPRRATCARALRPGVRSMRDRQTRDCAQARSRRAAPAALFGSRPEPGLFSSKALRECYQRRRSAGASATPSRARCATAAIWSDGHGDGRLGSSLVPITVRIVLSGNSHAEVSATSDIGTGTCTIGAGRSRHARTAARQHHNQTATRRCHSRRSKVDHGCGLGVQWCNDSERGREDLLRLATQMPNSPLTDVPSDEVVLSDGKRDAGPFARRIDRTGDAAWRSGPDRAGGPPPSPITARTRMARIRRSLPGDGGQQLGVIQ